MGHPLTFRRVWDWFVANLGCDLLHWNWSLANFSCTYANFGCAFLCWNWSFANCRLHTKCGFLSTFATLVVPTYTGTGLSPTSVVLIYSKSGTLQTLGAPIFTGSGNFGNFRCTCLGFNTFLSPQLCLSWLNLRFTNILVVGLDYIWTWLNWWKL